MLLQIDIGLLGKGCAASRHADVKSSAVFCIEKPQPVVELSILPSIFSLFQNLMEKFKMNVQVDMLQTVTFMLIIR